MILLIYCIFNIIVLIVAIGCFLTIIDVHFCWLGWHRYNELQPQYKIDLPTNTIAYMERRCLMCDKKKRVDSRDSYWKEIEKLFFASPKWKETRGAMLLDRGWEVDFVTGDPVSLSPEYFYVSIVEGDFDI